MDGGPSPSGGGLSPAIPGVRRPTNSDASYVRRGWYRYRRCRPRLLSRVRPVPIQPLTTQLLHIANDARSQLIACQDVNRGIVIQCEENTKDTFPRMEGFGI